MPNIKSAKKRVLVSAANYERNKAYRSGLRTAIKKANVAIAYICINEVGEQLARYAAECPVAGQDTDRQTSQGI